MRLRWTYALVAVPTLVELLEDGAFPTTLRGILTDVSLSIVLVACAFALCRQADRLMELAQTDPLTGLYNRRRFTEDLSREVGRAARQRMPLALAYLDVSRFKAINDTHGHDEGDRVLVRLSEFLSATVRKHVDSCYRLGGDEFALLMPGAVPGGVGAILDRIRDGARGEPVALARYGADLAFGSADLQPGESADAFLTRADQLMLDMKQKSRSGG